MTYKRKTRDVWELQANHGCGWECETTELTWSAIRQRRAEYRDNCPGIVLRIVRKREPIEHS